MPYDAGAVAPNAKVSDRVVPLLCVEEQYGV